MIRLRGVLGSVNLDVGRGEIVVLTGEPRGTSALLRVMAGLEPATGGSVTLDGTVAFADGWLAPGDELTAGEYLNFALGRCLGDDASALAERAQLRASMPLRTLGPDERVRLSIACALASRRDAILLDAPIAPCFVEWITDVQRDGSAVVIAGPVPEPAFAHARVLRLSGGRLEAAFAPMRTLAGVTP